MKFAVDTAHRDFFRNHLTIEFQDFFTPEQLQLLQQLIRSALTQRLAEKGLNFGKASSEDLYMAGRDLWRNDEALRKFIVQNKLADIAADLTEEREIRLGYDQFIPSFPPHLDKLAADSPYVMLLNSDNATLETISSIQGVLCGVMICLKDASPLSSSIFPKRAGNVVYFDARAPLDFSSSSEGLMIVYTRGRALYILQSGDPHTHAFKRLGYIFGDTLKDKLNPMLKR